MTRNFSCVCFFLAASMWTTSAVAQDAADTPALTHPGMLTRAVEWAGAKLDGPSAPRDGFYPEMGGMIPGAGLSAGPGYRRRLFGERMIVDASAAVSWRRYKMMQSQLTWPRLMNNRLSLGAQVKYQDFTQINHFGIGRDTLKSSQTNYRLQDLDTLGVAEVRARPWLTISGRAGLLQRVDIGAGRSSLHPSTSERFDERSSPGLSEQPDYVHADLAGDVDTRDVRGYPTRGGRYRASMATFRDQDLARYSFHRVEVDAAQYIPLGRTVLALRGRIDASATGAGQSIPFYLLPALGGSSSLRGYADYRFRDRDLLLANAEYRWPLFHAVDAAIFYDAGTVAPRFSGLGRRLLTDYGVGVRAHSAMHLIARFDVARGSEGTRALLTFTAPLALPSHVVAPYVP
jgi:outer membrane protein assembly factor BamA